MFFVYLCHIANLRIIHYGKTDRFIFYLFFLNLLIHNAYAYNLKQVADKEYMSNSSITSCARMNVD